MNLCAPRRTVRQEGAARFLEPPLTETPSTKPQAPEKPPRYPAGAVKMRRMSTAQGPRAFCLRSLRALCSLRLNRQWILSRRHPATTAIVLSSSEGLPLVRDWDFPGVWYFARQLLKNW